MWPVPVPGRSVRSLRYGPRAFACRSETLLIRGAGRAVLLVVLVLMWRAPAWGGDLLYGLDFGTVDNDSPLSLLERIGFVAKEDMDVSGRIGLAIADGALILKAARSASGMLLNQSVHILNARTVEIQWGVERYPLESSWPNGINREALMVILFFGKKVPADRFFLPNIPYFIGLFLCNEVHGERVFVGKSYTKTGRYICMGNPVPGSSVESTFEIEKMFRTLFKVIEVPPITGISLEVDTSGLSDGRAEAHIRSIKFFGREGQTSGNRKE